jgi:hypothetical protein
MGVKQLRASKTLLFFATLLICALLFLQGVPPLWAEDGESQCVACHTTPRQLIGSVREMEKERGSGPKVSTETEGEG